ncbi:MAG: hypothetical protein ONB11_10395 [candidate division KSB1 bacterium]|nr:hypothetical protein [candidate division KSB1 bacterium]
MMVPIFKAGILGALMLLLCFGASVLAMATESAHQVQLSTTLSGHMMLGLGYTYYWNVHQGWQTIFYLIPEKGWPYGISTGYNHLWGEKKWRPNLTADFMVLASPPDPAKRKYLTMFKLVPGIQYDFKSDQNLNSRLWIAYFLKQTRAKIAPIGLELMYGHK